MALSDEARKRLVVALTDREVGAEVAEAIDVLDNVKYIPVAAADPGTGAAIPVLASASIAITTAAAETNTLDRPTFIGQRLVLACNVFAVGARVVTASAAINQAGNTTMTFGAAGDVISLEGVQVAGLLRWQVMANDGVALA